MFSVLTTTCTRVKDTAVFGGDDGLKHFTVLLLMLPLITLGCHLLRLTTLIYVNGIILRLDAYAQLTLGKECTTYASVEGLRDCILLVVEGKQKTAKTKDTHQHARATVAANNASSSERCL